MSTRVRGQSDCVRNGLRCRVLNCCVRTFFLFPFHCQCLGNPPQPFTRAYLGCTLGCFLGVLWVYPWVYPWVFFGCTLGCFLGVPLGVFWVYPGAYLYLGRTCTLGLGRTCTWGVPLDPPWVYPLFEPFLATFFLGLFFVNGLSGVVITNGVVGTFWCCRYFFVLSVLFRHFVVGFLASLIIG